MYCMKNEQNIFKRLSERNNTYIINFCNFLSNIKHYYYNRHVFLTKFMIELKYL